MNKSTSKRPYSSVKGTVSRTPCFVASSPKTMAKGGAKKNWVVGAGIV